MTSQAPQLRLGNYIMNARIILLVLLGTSLLLAASGCRRQLPHLENGKWFKVGGEFLPIAPNETPDSQAQENQIPQGKPIGVFDDSQSDKDPEQNHTAQPVLQAESQGDLEDGAQPPALQRAPKKIARRQIPELQTVYFDFNYYTLKDEAMEILQHAAVYLAKHPQTQVLIQGHTDSRGTTEYNMNLGQRRAIAAREYLIEKGVNPSQLYTLSLGEESPANTEENEEGWALNRRAEFYVY